MRLTARQATNTAPAGTRAKRSRIISQRPFVSTAKHSKEEARYSRGHKSAHCGICEHYQGGLCSKVKGYIDPDMWCEYFKRKSSKVG